jgi:phospholipid-binding lipoprotein MlaA
MTANLCRRRGDHTGVGCALWIGVLLMLFVLSGCASGPNANPRDPLEPFNRGVFKFNDAVDTAVLKPVATAYQDITPALVRQGIGNFFGNLKDAWSFVNNALQLKGQAAADSLTRFGVNTFIGLGGILDVATKMDIEKHTKDFGHTLGYWGVAPGPYLVLPLLGPSTLRDTVALPVDLKGDIVANISHVPTRNTVTAVRAVDDRAALLIASTMLEEAALDPYAFIRDAFLQRRRSVIYDGNPPEEDTFKKLPAQQDLAQPRAETSPETLIQPGVTGDEEVKP